MGETTTLTSAYTNNDELIHATSFYDGGKRSRDKGNECAATASNLKSLITNCNPQRDIVDNESADGSTAELLRRLESRATTTTTTTRRRRYVAYVGMVAAGLMALVVFLSVAMVLEVPKLKVCEWSNWFL